MSVRFAKLTHCVYVLFSEADDKLYIGYTTDLKRRLTEHFHGRVQSTAPRRPLKLIYCEYHESGSDARRREKYFKIESSRSTASTLGVGRNSSGGALGWTRNGRRFCTIERPIHGPANDCTRKQAWSTPLMLIGTELTGGVAGIGLEGWVKPVSMSRARSTT